MDLEIFWPDFSSINTLPPKSQCGVLDLSVLNNVPFYAYQLPDMLHFMLIIVGKT